MNEMHCICCIDATAIHLMSLCIVYLASKCVWSAFENEIIVYDMDGTNIMYESNNGSM